MPIELEFGNRTLEIDIGWEDSLRKEGMGYHIRTRTPPAYGADRKIELSGWSIVDAAHTPCWADALGKALTGAEVLGFSDSPQAIRLHFGLAEVMICIGYSGSPPEIGDGDELLVFSSSEWLAAFEQRPTWQGDWQLLASVR